MTRRNSDAQIRDLERAYLAFPDDRFALRSFLRAVTRTGGDMVATINALWQANDLIPDHADLDVLAEVAFDVSGSSERLRENMEAIEKIALATEAADTDDLDLDEMDEDQRSPWWRRERFHDLDFDRDRPYKGGRLYSPARGTFLTVSEVTRNRGGDRAPERRGYLLVEAPTENLVEGLDSVLVDMAKDDGPTPQHRRPLSAWALGRILRYVARAAAAPRVGHQITAPYKDAIFVTYPGDDPTDVVERVTGAPASPLGGGPHYHVGSRGPSVGLWLGRTGRFTVMRESSQADGSFSNALWHWRIARHPYRVRLSELRTNYWAERGGEELTLIWVGRGKDPQERDGETVARWSNEPDPDTAEFAPGESIMEQLNLRNFPGDWTEAAARDVHDGGLIVVENWERQGRPGRPA